MEYFVNWTREGKTSRFAYPKVREEFVARICKTGATTQLAAEVLADCIEPGDIPKLFDVIKDVRDGIANAMYRAMGEVATHKEPVGDSSNSYEVIPVDLTEVRKWLFGEAQNNGVRAKVAYHLLSIIENQREHYGRPPSEPRHPDLGSGKPWPMSEPHA